MSDVLVDYAIQNIWCNPNQDKQYVFKPKRVTSYKTAINKVRVVDRILELPTRNTKYHVFQIGQINPNTLSILRDAPDWLIDRWVRFDETINNNGVWLSLYDDNGITAPRFSAYTMYMDERNLIIALEVINDIKMDYIGNIYLRVYKNSYFESGRFPGGVRVHTDGKHVLSTNDALDLQTSYILYDTFPGKTFAYVNGLLVDKIDLYNATIGSYVEFVYDASVKRVVTFNLATLDTFVSKLDILHKYLLHYDNADIDTIEYFDDNDIYITKIGIPTRFMGNYFYRHLETTVRMVTHRDYSLNVSHVTYLADRLRIAMDHAVGSLANYQLKLYVRHSGYKRELIYENHKLHELYKLNDTWVRESMLGSGTSIPLWRCEELEASKYTALMSMQPSTMTREDVVEALGYNAISKLYADTPQLRNSHRVVNLPLLLREDSTVYEYDVAGNLITFNHHVTGSDYIPIKDEAVYFECIRGTGTTTPDVYWGDGGDIPVPIGCNWRLYKCHVINDRLDDIWSDITDTDEYQIVNGKIRYIVDDARVQLMLRTDKKFLAYGLTVVAIDGCIQFPLSEYQDRGSGVLHYVMPIPAGELEVFLNGRNLIEGLGYIVNFPMVTIINKEYQIQPADTSVQHIHVRFKGLCNKNLEWDKPKDVGFIEHGVLSNNNKFDVRDDKIQRIIVDGYMRRRSEVVFSELHNGISILNAVNGLPYCIKDIVVPLRDIMSEDTYKLRVKSQAKDDMISHYMTDKLPQPLRDGVSVITRLHELYSPFICKILHDIVSGTITVSAYSLVMSNQDVLDVCKPYEDWLKYDPITDEHHIDARYVIIHPHNRYDVMVINLYAYRFMIRVIRLYAKDRVTLSPFVAVEHQL
jgi:hypothetical protein